MRPAHPVCLQQSCVPHVAFNMRNASMGTTADSITRNVAAQSRAPVGDLAAHRSARQLFKEAEIHRDGFEWRIANGLDPCFAVYAHAQAMVSITAEQPGNNGRVDDDVFIAIQGEMLVSDPPVYQAAG